MPTYAVTRHAGALAFIRKTEPDAIAIPEINDEMLHSLKAGDRVIGPLPLALIADLTERGVHYEAIDLTVPLDRRGSELSADEMFELGAKRRPYFASRLSPSAAITAPASTKPLPPARQLYWSRSRRILLPIILAVMAGIAVKTATLILDQGKAIVQQAFLVIGGQPAVMNWTQIGSHAAEVAGWLLLMGLAVFLTNKLSNRVLFATFAQETPDARRVLVQGLSNLRDAYVDQDGVKRNAAQIVEAFSAFPITISGLGTSALTTEIERLEREVEGSAPDEAAHSRLRQLQAFKKIFGDNKFQWQQNMRTILHNLDRLERVYVIPSTQSKNDVARFVTMAEQALKRAGRKDIAIRVRSPIEYDQHDSCRDALAQAQKLAARDIGARPIDIAIDGTSGTKIFSIAAAIATVNTKANLLYVDNDGKIVAFDGSIALMERNAE